MQSVAAWSTCAMAPCPLPDHGIRIASAHPARQEIFDRYPDRLELQNPMPGRPASLHDGRRGLVDDGARVAQMWPWRIRRAGPQVDDVRGPPCARWRMSGGMRPPPTGRGTGIAIGTSAHTIVNPRSGCVSPRCRVKRAVSGVANDAPTRHVSAWPCGLSRGQRVAASASGDLEPQHTSTLLVSARGARRRT